MLLCFVWLLHLHEKTSAETLLCYFSQESSKHHVILMFLMFADSVSDCKKFKDLVDEIAEQQGKNEEKESEEVSSAAELVEKLTVTEDKKEEQTEKVETPAVDDKKDAEE